MWFGIYVQIIRRNVPLISSGQTSATCDADAVYFIEMHCVPE
jgi:hypothetical protein